MKQEIFFGEGYKFLLKAVRIDSIKDYILFEEERFNMMNNDIFHQFDQNLIIKIFVIKISVVFSLVLSNCILKFIGKSKYSLMKFLQRRNNVGDLPIKCTQTLP